MDATVRGGGRRNKGFEETHRELIETAVRLISEKGADALSVAALARAAGINRTTVYYHFDSREALLAAVKSWAGAQLDNGMDLTAAVPERIAAISRFVLDNPELIKLWIDDFISGGDIRASYARWDDLVSGVAAHFAKTCPEEKIDAEVYCVMLLTSSIIGPRVYAAGVRPGVSHDTIVRRFLAEHQRTLRRDGLVWQ